MAVFLMGSLVRFCSVLIYYISMEYYRADDVAERPKIK